MARISFMGLGGLHGFTLFLLDGMLCLCVGVARFHIAHNVGPPSYKLVYKLICSYIYTQFINSYIYIHNII